MAAGTKLGYKFVNPALSGEEKAAAKSIGATRSGSLPYAKVLLGVNRLGATCDGIYKSVKALKSIEEVRAISLREDETDTRRAIRRQKDQAVEDKIEASAQDQKKIAKSGEDEIKKDQKKRKGLLQQVFGPIIDILNVFMPFIKYAAIMGALEFFRKPENLEKVKNLVELLGEVFKFLYDWANFGISNLLNGLGNVFGGIGKFKEGNVLGGAWDTIMGFGQLLVGLIALRGLQLFLNPWKLMGSILDMLDILDRNEGRGGREPSADPSKPDKPTTKKPKTAFQKLVQRMRIAFKRMKRRYGKIAQELIQKATKFANKMAAMVVKFAMRAYYDFVKPAAMRLIEQLMKSTPGQFLLDSAKSAKSLVLSQADKIRQSAGDLLNRGKTAAKDGITAVQQSGTRFVNWVRGTKVGQAVEGAAKKVAEGARNLWKGVISIPDKAKSAWKWTQDMAKQGQEYILQKVLEPLKANVDAFIKNSPILQKLLSLFPKKGAKAGFSSAFKKFSEFVKPHLTNLKNTLKPLNLGPLDIAIEAAFALMDLKAGTDPRRVALKLGGSVAGLIAGGAATAALGLGTGGIGAALAGGVILGAAQWGGEWVGNKIADMMGIPPEKGFSTGGIITKRSLIEVAEDGRPEFVLTQDQMKNLLASSKQGITGAEYLIGASSAILDVYGQSPGAQQYKSELSGIASQFGEKSVSVSKGETVKKPNLSGILSGFQESDPFSDLINFLKVGSTGALDTYIEEDSASKSQDQTGGSGGPGGGGGGGGAPDAGPAAPVSGEFGKRVSALLGSYEGLRLEAYPDAIYGWGVPTIGIGATYYPSGFRLKGKVKKGDKITKDEAYEIKSKHVATFVSKIQNEVGASVYEKLPEKVKAPLISKAFNYGSLGSALAGLVKKGDVGAIAAYFRNTLAKHDGGINSWRRNDEAAVMTTGSSPRAKVSFASSGGSIPLKEGSVVIPSNYPAPGKIPLKAEERLGMISQLTSKTYNAYHVKLEELKKLGYEAELLKKDDDKGGGLFGGLFGGGGGGGFLGGLFGGGGGGLLGAVGGILGGPVGAIAGNAIGGLLGGKSITDVAFGAASSFVPGLGGGLAGKALEFGKSAFSDGFNPGNIAKTAFGQFGGQFGIDSNNVFGSAAKALTGSGALGGKLTGMQQWARNFPELAKKVKFGQSGFDEIQSVLNPVKGSLGALVDMRAAEQFLQGGDIKTQSSEKETRDEKEKRPAIIPVAAPVPLPINKVTGGSGFSPNYVYVGDSLLTSRFDSY